MVRGAFSPDWAIGAAAWRKALAREHAHLAPVGRGQASVHRAFEAINWNASNRWRASFAMRSPLLTAGSRNLYMGKAGSVRAYVYAAKQGVVGSD